MQTMVKDVNVVEDIGYALVLIVETSIDSCQSILLSTMASEENIVLIDWSPELKLFKMVKSNVVVSNHLFQHLLEIKKLVFLQKISPFHHYSQQESTSQNLRPMMIKSLPS
ncbi:hypothetical protein LIER_11147 [Lithospermum erythrorhizon]|uniref:Uncharacterized protein n=1 Tax=Lithospermum erythrorhizon TaxID=34254 RepID=A0AAV3PS43_LITER